MFREEVFGADSGADAHFEVLGAERGGRCTDAKVGMELRRGAEGCEKQDARDQDFFHVCGFCV